MKYKYFIGIDVSKLTLDISVIFEGELIAHERINNKKDKIKEWVRVFCKQKKTSIRKLLFCFESTGIYHSILKNALKYKSVSICIESPLRIKRSLGIQRGKNDKIDSYRIAEYAWLNKGKIRLAPSVRPEIEELKRLNTLRLRLLKLIHALKVPLKDEYLYSKAKPLSLLCDRSLHALAQDLKDTNEQMDFIIKSDETLNHLYEIATSIPYVGRIVAIETIIATNEFKNFTSAKKFACHMGIAPFEHSSGTSLKVKGHTSQLSNRRLKTLFHMPVLAITKGKGELSNYYQKKVAEGHPKLSVINAIKNKLLYRIFACIKEDRMYSLNPPASRVLINTLSLDSLPPSTDIF